MSSTNKLYSFQNLKTLNFSNLWIHRNFKFRLMHNNLTNLKLCEFFLWKLYFKNFIFYNKLVFGFPWRRCCFLGRISANFRPFWPAWLESWVRADPGRNPVSAPLYIRYRIKTSCPFNIEILVYAKNVFSEIINFKKIVMKSEKSELNTQSNFGNFSKSHLQSDKITYFQNRFESQVVSESQNTADVYYINWAGPVIYLGLEVWGV